MHWPHSPALGGHGLMVEPDWNGGWGGGGALENEMVHDPGEWGVPLAHGLASGFAELLLLPLCWLALNNNTNTNLLQHVSL